MDEVITEDGIIYGDDLPMDECSRCSGKQDTPECVCENPWTEIDTPPAMPGTWHRDDNGNWVK